MKGKQELHNAKSVQIFLESIMEQEDRCVCIERLFTSSKALQGLKRGLRLDITPAFVNNYLARFLDYISDRYVKQLCNGSWFRRILVMVVEPPGIWNQLMDFFENRLLSPKGVYAFAWLMAELLCLQPTLNEIDILEDACKVLRNGTLLAHPDENIRMLGENIKRFYHTKLAEKRIKPIFGPGGRHDNDFDDFRRIAIYPTPDEFRSNEQPFYQPMHAIMDEPMENRVGRHIGNQFRLLREDMLCTLKDELLRPTELKKARFVVTLGGLSLKTITCESDDPNRLPPCALAVQCNKELGSFTDDLKDSWVSDLLPNGTRDLKHGAYGCFVHRGEVIAFAKVRRIKHFNRGDPPILPLEISSMESLEKTLICFKEHSDIQLRMVQAPLYMYEPVLLALQTKVDMSCMEALLVSGNDSLNIQTNLVPFDIINDIHRKDNRRLRKVLQSPKAINLDESQWESLRLAVKYRLSLIHGPPGTGKSFIGALITEIFYQFTEEKILIMCHTNHSLDQFLEHLLDRGINKSAIVRLGSESTARTEELRLAHELAMVKGTRYREISKRTTQDARDHWEAQLNTTFRQYEHIKADSESIVRLLESTEPGFYRAFIPKPSMENEIPDTASVHLYTKWCQNKKPGNDTFYDDEESQSVWNLEPKERQTLIFKWKKTLLENAAVSVCNNAYYLNQSQEWLQDASNDRIREVLARKQIIGCTTTGGAIYASILRTICPGIVILEEAGEILESHALATIGPETKQLVMIGDHQQLRPKINSHSLSVKKGDGYNLDVSLFERLIRTGHRCTVLSQQHRMCPEISKLVRELTYHDLIDGPTTKERPALCGLQDRVIFIDHDSPECEVEILERLDEELDTSRANMAEVSIVAEVLENFVSEGYSLNDIVVLAPYSGQVTFLREEIEQRFSIYLDDWVSDDSTAFRGIKVDTLDSFQGEESRIIIASLTRSNDRGDIGFMADRNRVNVLLSRARDVLILVGSVKTFASSVSGQGVWGPLIRILREHGHIYEQLPIIGGGSEASSE
ncbi:hypothetical protein MauCBS54593_001825 [Microsporum audouinii]